MTIFLNKKEIVYEKYPDGSILFKDIDSILSKYCEVITLDVFAFNSDDILSSIFLANHIKNVGFHVKTVYQHLPNMRQDKQEKDNPPCSEILFQMLNNAFLGLGGFIVICPHSMNVCAIYDTYKDLIHRTEEAFLGGKTIFYPDKSSYQRLRKEFKNILQCTPEYTADKKRIDSKIVLSIPENANVQGKDIFIPDDICDGGWTFKLLGEKLREKGAKSLHLHVHHGLFSGDMNMLSDYDSLSCHYFKQNILTGVDCIPLNMKVVLKNINGKLIEV